MNGEKFTEATCTVQIGNSDDKKQLPQNPARNRCIIGWAEELLPKDSVRDFNFSLLDLSALICKTRTPLCRHCPVQEFCVFGNTNKQLSQ